jgi:nitroreductase
MANDVYDAVRTVLAIREYQDKEVAEDVIARVVDAGRVTASSMNLQPWHFVVVRERDRLSQLGKLVASGPYIAQADFAVVAAYETDSPFGVSDTSRAIQSMILTAWEEGVGSNWTGFGGLGSVREYVGLGDGYTVLAVFPFGYPARPVGLGKKKRKPLHEVASAEHAGTGFE